MRRPSPTVVLVVGLFCAAAVSALDLRRVEHNTLVIYTTSALKDVLEQSIVPRFERATGIHVQVDYTKTAGQEYYNVLMTRDRPEADLFLHASPLFIEKGYAAGLFEPYPVPPGANTSDTPQRRAPDGQAIWTAFATSPLVEVYSKSQGAEPDLNRTNLRWGLPHPQLSNNGIYAALFFDSTSRIAGRKAVDFAVVQPTNAQANMAGAADGTFDLTIGYEAVAKLYQEKGAKISYALPLLDGRIVTTNVLFSAGLVNHHPHPGAQQFIDFLFTPAIQQSLGDYTLRPAVPGIAASSRVLDLTGAVLPDYDWSRWAELESRLPDYVVQR